MLMYWFYLNPPYHGGTHPQNEAVRDFPAYHLGTSWVKQRESARLDTAAHSIKVHRCLADQVPTQSGSSEIDRVAARR